MALFPILMNRTNTAEQGENAPVIPTVAQVVERYAPLAKGTTQDRDRRTGWIPSTEGEGGEYNVVYGYDDSWHDRPTTVILSRLAGGVDGPTYVVVPSKRGVFVAEPDHGSTPNRPYDLYAAHKLTLATETDLLTALSISLGQALDAHERAERAKHPQTNGRFFTRLLRKLFS